MKLINLTVRAALKKPMIIVLPGFIMLLFVVLNSYNPMLPVLLGLSSATGSSVLEGLVSFLQLLISPEIIPLIVFAIFVVALIGSLLAAVLFSGYLHIVNITLAGEKKTSGDFTKGVKVYFSRVFQITLKAVLIVVFLVAFIAVACVPAVIITRAAASTRPELLVAAVFVDLLTAGVLFFSLMFSRAYLFYWYPAAINTAKKPFREAKLFVDHNFWHLVLRFLVFDIVFVIFEFVIFNTGDVTLNLLLNWLFCTIFFTILTIFIMSSYKNYSDKTIR